MAHEAGDQKPLGSYPAGPETKRQGWILLLLRFLALFAIVSTTLLIILTKETKTIVVATIETTEVTAALKARFQHTPAYVFFVIVNGIASIHHFATLMADLVAYIFDFKGFWPSIITLLDMGKVGLVSTGLGAATAMAELGTKGNSHDRWCEICDHGGGTLIISFIGLGFLMFLHMLSIVTLFKKHTNELIVP
ncbi:CASP-like protein 1B2 [Macadamia integrifolia]|uniref:CASP-like protein 1B2 n=1 Tax=Macadamia integrifolia TaxID=60698 RepID=UPI001C4E4363|nr:CASP-like protein 1B2 [Macadamia integrifolia]